MALEENRERVRKPKFSAGEGKRNAVSSRGSNRKNPASSHQGKKGEKKKICGAIPEGERLIPLLQRKGRKKKRGAMPSR